MINQESEFTVEEIEQRAKDNSDIYLFATMFDNFGEEPEESYYW